MNSHIIVMIFLSLCFASNFSESSSSGKNIINTNYHPNLSEIEEIQESSSSGEYIVKPTYLGVSEIEEIEESSSSRVNIIKPTFQPLSMIKEVEESSSSGENIENSDYPNLTPQDIQECIMKFNDRSCIDQNDLIELLNNIPSVNNKLKKQVSTQIMNMPETKPFSLSDVFKYLNLHKEKSPSCLSKLFLCNSSKNIKD